MYISYIFVALIVLFGTLTTIRQINKKPTLTKNWSEDQKKLPHANIFGDSVELHNIRNRSYASKQDYKVSYSTKMVNPDEITNVYYVLEPFFPFTSTAHVFLTFEFNHSEYIGISVEIRRTVGQKFSILRGLFNTYELIYVLATEQDLLGIRATQRKHSLYMYPVRIDAILRKKLFLALLERMNKLETEPEFYNSLGNNCMTNIVDAARAVTGATFSKYVFGFLPGRSDIIANKLNLLKTNGTIGTVRKKHKIDEKVREYINDPDFSKKIRENFADEL